MSRMILFLDGGYTPAAGNVTCVESIREYTQKEELITIKIEDITDWNKVYRYLEDAHAIVLAADVYLDSVSSKVLRFLEKVEQAVIGGESIGGKFYAILYTELYEGEQTSVAMEVLKNFCEHANISWGRGLGIGGNKVETILNRRKLLGSLRKNLTDFRSNSIYEQALFIREKVQGTDVYINPDGVTRNGYIRKMNQEIKKSNRVKTAQN
ncbi:MAG: hypothetical protein K2M91_04520 [Lachnospiraceae bacterium]|nr:hypothetical protein [Lachnospiraceae bacterium]